MTEPRIIKVAVATPLNQLFDYAVPGGLPLPKPGQRVRVPFGKREQIGVVVAQTDTADVATDKLRSVLDVLDDTRVLDDSLMELLTWAAAYYQHPPGEVYATALPNALRKGATAQAEREFEWRLTAAGRAQRVDALPTNATRKRAVLRALLAADTVSEPELRTLAPNWRPIVEAYRDDGWAERAERRSAPPETSVNGPEPTDAQRAAVAAVPTTGFAPCLLEGVTGSGKTEVYLQLIEQQLAAGRQTLVLVPEIGLTPQLIRRFTERLPGRIVALHSGLTDSQRLNGWVAARDGLADVIIGTRSAVFTPLPNAGLIIVDEEHDSSFKQQDGFRYSARDIAVFRARQHAVPVVLGSATPSFETLHNALEGRYRHMHLPTRPGSARQPDIHTIDLRHYPREDGLSQPLLAAMRRHLEQGNQALLYLNRRGFAPTLMCPACGETQECNRCDARLVLHQSRNRLICHHCGAERPRPETCADCNEELIAVGHGTERLEQALERAFPDTPLVRIDRDSTRRRGELEAKLEAIRSGEARILLGTQMLTKGHDFPDVTFVGIVDSDQGLFGTDFRSSERLAQSVLQVAGRAGRGNKAGEVWIQSYYPEHPLLRTLLDNGYDHFAREALEERRAAGWPPYSHIALLRAEAVDRGKLFAFLHAARQAAPGPIESVRLLGPATSPMERRSGRYRGQLLVQSTDRTALRRFLTAWRQRISELPDARRTRWSLDIDPVELF